MKRADAGWIGALMLGAAGLYFGLLQERFTADGPGFTNAYLSGRGLTYYNVLFLPYCRWIGALVSVAPERVPHVASAIAGVLAVGLTYPVLRAFELDRRRAAWGSALLAVTPPMLFFSTTAELHSLHLVCVLVVLLVTLHGPWQRPALALACTALVFPLLYWSHVTAFLLGPGWVLLVQHARMRRGEPFRWRTLLLVVGPVLLGMLVLAALSAGWYRTGRFAIDTAELSGRVELSYGMPLGHRMVVHGWLLPLLLIVPAAVVGLWRRVARAEDRGRDWLTWALVLLIVPSTVFYLVIGVAERGAYFIGTLPFWIVLVIHAFPAKRAGSGGALRVAAALALGVQALFGVRQVVEFDRGYRLAERNEQIQRVLGPEPTGTILSGGDWSLNARHFFPGVEEVSAGDVIRRYLVTDVAPSELAAMVTHGLEALVASTPVVVDLSYRGQPDNPVVAVLMPWLVALEEEYQQHYDTERFEHPDWPMLLLRTRPSEQ